MGDGGPAKKASELARSLASLPRPIEFDHRESELLRLLREKHRAALERTFSIYSGGTRADLSGDHLYRLERHLFPILEMSAARSGTSDTEDVVRFCAAFLTSYSSPVITANRALDDSRPVPGVDMAGAVAGIYDGISLLAGLPHGDRMLKVINDVYRSTVAAMLAEHERRFVLPAEDEVAAIRHGVADRSTTYYRSTCSYLRASVSALLASWSADAGPVQDPLRRFGIARQLCDEVVDLETDIARGLVTYPLIEIWSPTIAATVRRVWNGEAGAPAELMRSDHLQEGCAVALRHAQDHLHDAGTELDRLSTPSGTDFRPLRTFIDWKLGMSRRLTVDRRAPDFVNYAHLPPVDYIEGLAARSDRDRPARRGNPST